MRTIFQYLLIASVTLSLTGAPAVVYAMPEPAPAAQTAQQKAAEQKKKEAEKKKALAEKEQCARRMLGLGVPDETVALGMGYTIEQVRALAAVKA